MAQPRGEVKLGDEPRQVATMLYCMFIPALHPAKMTELVKITSPDDPALEDLAARLADLAPGLEEDDVVRGVGIAMADGPAVSSHPAGYEITDTSNRVVRFISSTAGRHAQWAGVRRS